LEIKQLLIWVKNHLRSEEAITNGSMNLVFMVGKKARRIILLTIKRKAPLFLKIK
jgi:hypothetical protein